MKKVKKNPSNMIFAILISGGSLKLHISWVHEEKKLFKCEICGKSFQHKKSLTGHITHEGKKHLNVIFVTTTILLRVT